MVHHQPRLTPNSSRSLAPHLHQRTLDGRVHGVSNRDVHASHEQISWNHGTQARDAVRLHQVLVLQELDVALGHLGTWHARQLWGRHSVVVELVNGRREASTTNVAEEIATERGQRIAGAGGLLDHPSAWGAEHAQTRSGD